jgi:hypothetical protein
LKYFFRYHAPTLPENLSTHKNCRGTCFLSHWARRLSWRETAQGFVRNLFFHGQTVSTLSTGWGLFRVGQLMPPGFLRTPNYGKVLQ